MNPQAQTIIPIPIIEEIIYLSQLKEKLSFRQSCKLFFHSTNREFFPTITTTLCGCGEQGFEDGEALRAKFNYPEFGALDSSSNILYVSDTNNHVIRRIDLSTNKVDTLCGTPTTKGFKDGIGSESQFNSPTGLALNEKEKVLYVSDSGNNAIRRVNLIDGRVDTLCGNGKRGSKDGIGNEATFNYPKGLAFDSISNYLYVADCNNNSIRRIILNERRVETLCGSGEGYVDGSFEESKFYYPYDIVLNSSTEELYVSDCCNHVIRVISLKNRRVSTLCGTPQQEGYENGIHNQSKFKYPGGLGLDINSNCLYVTDGDNQVVRRISLSGEVRVSTLCGIVGKSGSRDGLNPTFNYPTGIVVDPHSQSLYVMDSNNNKVRKIIDRSRILREESSPTAKNQKLE